MSIAEDLRFAEDVHRYGALPTTEAVIRTWTGCDTLPQVVDIVALRRQVIDAWPSLAHTLDRLVGEAAGQ